MASWAALARELDTWSESGRPASFWWRDDDAIAPSLSLASLLAASRRYGVPLALAVIPARTQAALAALIAREPTVTALQHGYAHVNHAADGAKNGELGPARAPAVNARELGQGAVRMAALFGAPALPVLVPPWNRIDPALIPLLPGLGFRGLSTYGPRQAAEPAPGLRQANSHLDVIDWRGRRGFIGEAKALAQLVDHLAARRTGNADASEPTGLLTHHLVHDDAAWAFLEALFTATRRHPAARWWTARDAFELHEPAAPTMADGARSAGSR